VEGGKEDMKSTENDYTIIQEILRQLNVVFKEQLAKLQDDNMKLTIALHGWRSILRSCMYWQNQHSKNG
jgi:hypothetical protein